MSFWWVLHMHNLSWDSKPAEQFPWWLGCFVGGSPMISFHQLHGHDSRNLICGLCKCIINRKVSPNTWWRITYVSQCNTWRDPQPPHDPHQSPELTSKPIHSLQFTQLHSSQSIRILSRHNSLNMVLHKVFRWQLRLVIGSTLIRMNFWASPVRPVRQVSRTRPTTSKTMLQRRTLRATVAK